VEQLGADLDLAHRRRPILEFSCVMPSMMSRDVVVEEKRKWMKEK
jgi:hypothetical protein